MVKILEGCIGCGLCESSCPDVFAMGDDDKAYVKSQPQNSADVSVQDAADGCPVSVIVIEA